MCPVSSSPSSSPTPAQPRRAAITGVGVLSALGVGQAEFVAGLSAGRTAFTRRRFEDVRLGSKTLFGAFAPDPPVRRLLGRKGYRTFNRESLLFSCAAVLACRDGGLEAGSWQGERTAVVVGTMLSGLEDYVQLTLDGALEGVRRINPAQGPQTSFNAPAGQFAIRYSAEGPNFTITNGCPSAVEALIQGADLIASEVADTVLVGGVDVLGPLTAYAVTSSGAVDDSGRPPRPFDRDRSGPVAGEAACVLLLEEVERARERGARIRAMVHGGALSFAPGGELEDACRRAIDGALEESSVGAESVGLVCAAASGDRRLDAAEAGALASRCADRVPVFCVKGATGECFGAGSAVQMAAAIAAFDLGSVPATQGWNEADPELPRLAITTRRVAVSSPWALVTSLDTEGGAAAVVLAATGRGGGT